MRPEYLKIPCGSNNKLALRNCTALVNKEGLIECLDLMNDIQEQRPQSTVMQTMFEFAFDDGPNYLFEKFEFNGEQMNVGLSDDQLVLVSNFETEEEELKILRNDLVIYPNQNDGYSMYYRIFIKHCNITLQLMTLMNNKSRIFLNNGMKFFKKTILKLRKSLKIKTTKRLGMTPTIIKENNNDF